MGRGDRSGVRTWVPARSRGRCRVSARRGGLVLAGGAARRMGGIDKLGFELGGVTILDRVLGAAKPVADPLVVVGPRRPTTVRSVRFVHEAQPGGGPVPAVLAGLEQLRGAEVVLLLAGDLPLVATTDLVRLLAALAGDPGLQAAAAADHAGRPNPLLAAYRAPHLRAAVGELSPGAPARRLLPQSVVTVDLGATATLNVNFRADLERAASLLDQRGRPSVPVPGR
ncbi:MAG: molybdenum cofactor guanylyltransferase [Acidimicrobiales bacterium]|nr:molybdenum cofactor guanylyltransferase [Actinomycetota bacterium]